MFYGLCFMVYGLCFMVYVLWFMFYGLCFMVYVLWFKIYFLSFRHNSNQQNYNLQNKMAKSAWMIHLAKFRKEHPGMDPKKVFGEAAKTYKKQSGGSALGGSLSPTPISGITETSGAGLQLDATMYSGGKRSASKRSASKRSASKRSARKHSAGKRSASKRSARKRSSRKHSA